MCIVCHQIHFKLIPSRAHTLSVHTFDNSNAGYLHHASTDRANGPDANDVVSVASVEGGTVRRPLEGRAVRLLGSLADRRELRAEFIDDGLGFEIPNLDARLGRRAQPVAVRGEAETVDDVTGIEGVEALAFTEIPEHGNTVLATRGAQGAIRRDGDGVDVASVTNEVGADLAVGKVPDLDELVPATGDDDRVASHRGEANAGHPFGVRVAILNRVLALAERVPQLDSLVSGARDDLTVVDGEGNGQHILSVTDEASGGGTGVQVPEAEGTVPGAREGKLAIGGDHDVLDEVRVTVKAAARVAVVLFLAGEVPEDNSLIAGGGQQNVRVVVQRGRDGRDPVFVSAGGRCFARVNDSQSIRSRVRSARVRRLREEQGRRREFNRFRFTVCNARSRPARSRHRCAIDGRNARALRPYFPFPRARPTPVPSDPSPRALSTGNEDEGTIQVKKRNRNSTHPLRTPRS